MEMGGTHFKSTDGRWTTSREDGQPTNRKRPRWKCANNLGGRMKLGSASDQRILITLAKNRNYWKNLEEKSSSTVLRMVENDVEDKD